ncbi:MAG: hypothetical protein ACTSRX_09520 [Promethearchaeota archaeon]
MAKNAGLARILAIIGGIIIVVEAIWGFLNGHVAKVINIGFLDALGAIVGTIIAVVIGVLVLISTGVLKSNNSKIGFNGVLILVLGILGILFASTIGGVLVIIAGILMLI